MRNPLHFSSALLVKRATAQPPVLNIQPYKPQPNAVAMSDDQIASLLQNIQTYPEEQQQQILDSINQDYGSSKYRGGFLGGIFGNLGNYGSSFGNTLQQGANWASQGLFGVKPFDAQDSDRYRAETVLRTAATNPEMYNRVTERINKVTTPTAPATTPTTPTAPATTAPQPPAAATTAQQAPGNISNIVRKLTTVTPPMLGPIKPQNSTPTTQAPVTPTPTPTPTPTAAQSAAPTPRKEGLIEGRPASQWIEQNKARQQRDINNAKKISTPSSAPSGMIYDSVSGQMVPKGFNRYKTNR